MIYAELDAAALAGRADLHRKLAEALDLPEWYGGNLDGLFDCLTDRREETRLCIRHADRLADALGPYGSRLLAVLEAARGENPAFQFSLEEGDRP